MSSNIVGLHFGQCGNQIGYEFWKTLAVEHGLTQNGMAKDRPDGKPREDNLTTFFSEADHNRYMPRAVMVDLEPRVINGIFQGEHSEFFKKTSAFMSDHGGGAGNNWASGYMQGKEVFDQVVEIIRAEVERADNLEGFMLTHSVSGGTGSGLGSFFLERIRELYPKKVVQTYSVFANQTGGASDVIVSPYNSVLTLNRLIHEADAVVILDNTALHHVAGNHLKMAKNKFDHINYLVSRIMSMSTATIRFPSPLFSRLTSLLATLVPFAPLRFLQTSMHPVVDPRDAVEFCGVTNVNGVMRQLLRPVNMMISRASKANQSPGCMLAGLTVMQGRIDHAEFTTGLTSGTVQMMMREEIRRPPWMTYNPLHVGKAPLSPFVDTTVNVSGLLLANHTSAVSLLDHTLRQHVMMRKKQAYLDRFQREEGFTLEEMDQSAEAVGDLVAEYAQVEKAEYFEMQ